MGENQMSWDSSTPYRTGVPSTIKYAGLICRLLAVFTPVIKEHLDSELHIYVDALNLACANFVDNVPPPRD